MKASRKRIQRASTRAQPGQPEHPDRDRDHPDVEADQRHQAVEAEVGVGRLDGRLDLVADRGAGGGEQHHLVALALDPGVDDLHLGAAEPADLLLGLGEDGEAVVDDRLLDLHRVGAVVAQVQLDLARAQHGALDRQLLLRARRCDRDRARRARRTGRSRRRAPRPGSGRSARPGRRAAAVAASISPPPRRSPSSPSSANSETWAWNMYLPVYGKRSSRMPRSPWPWMTVSVKSRGSRRVPVG